VNPGFSSVSYQSRPLLVWGAQDGLVHPAYGADFRALIAGARLEVVEGAGHLPQLEQAETTIGLITDFVG